ncbi:MAG: tRNA (adenosine(37)-N6)-threonylcarbamoyltransferase complex ATPase subunit type 1 TsaE [Candidatus Niyogibacteria bacterium]|nr:tRNA (adenosine(37)-N6)-threonylcarbamoyltransferase complex ATPase subunit type 1 TsaE [Candidatus Niyogibacteria bacterium]
MESLKVVTHSAKETQKLGMLLAKECFKIKQGRHALVIGLEGDLGGGKTTFMQGFARGLGIKENITSPTFVLLKMFKLARKNFRRLAHIDAYRLKSARGLKLLGWDELLSDPANIIVVEWADKVRAFMPKDRVRITFDYGDKNERKINVS